MSVEFQKLFQARRGHFELESGHHGELWLNLELLCERPAVVRPYAVQVAKQLEPFEFDAVCGPLIEGAFVAMIVAEQLDVSFYYSVPVESARETELFPVKYNLPGDVASRVADKRVVIVNDVINAGSAVRATYASLFGNGASIVAIATLLSLGPSPKLFASECGVPLISLATEDNRIWLPDECPLCASGVPLNQ